MDLPRVVHDEVLLQLEQPQHDHLANELRTLGHHAHVVLFDKNAPSTNANENTPLVVKAGEQRLYVDSEVDLVVLEKQFHEEENHAIAEDLQTPTAEVVLEELQQLVLLALPIMCTLLLELVPQLVIAMMVSDMSGDASPQVIAASALCDFLSNQTYVNVLSGVGAAVSTICARSYGAKHHEQLWLYAQAGLVACAYCFLPIAVVCLNGDWVLQMLGQDPVLTRLSGVMIWINLATVPFQMLYTIARSALQAQNIATPLIGTTAVAYAIALPLAYVIGYHTRLGYLGIVACFIVSNVIKVVVIVPVVVQTKLYQQAWPGWQWYQANRLAHKLWPWTAGSVLMVTFLTLGVNLLGLLAGFLPNAAVSMAASSITSSFFNLMYVPLVGLWIAGAVRVGNALGAGQSRRAFLTSAAVFATMLSVALVGVVAASTVAAPYTHAYTSNSDVMEQAVALIHHVLPMIPLTACIYAAQAIFQACDATWVCTKLNLGCFFVAPVPLGLLLALPLRGGVIGLWNGQLVGSFGFIVAAAVWLYRLDWHRTAHEGRLHVHLHVEQGPTTEPLVEEG